MATYKVFRLGSDIREIPTNNGLSEKEKAKAIETMLSIVPESVVDTYECDCVERLNTQDTFTRQEVLAIMRCSIKH